MTKQAEKHRQPGAGATAMEERVSASAAEGGNGATKERQAEGVLTRWPALLGGVPASPWELMRRMSEEMNQLFESLGGGGRGLTQLGQSRPAVGRASGTGGEFATVAPPILVPHIEVQQRPGQLVVRADLPGLRPEDINVTVDHGVLTISGERREEHRDEREGFVRSEVTYGTFFRTIPLPEGADENRVAATFRNGVLEISIPVSDREQGRRVKVQS
jgi:HSP20 family protein